MKVVNTTNTSKIYPLPVNLLSANENTPDFSENILSRFQKKEIADICQTDQILQVIGQNLWKKVKNKEDSKKHQPGRA